MKIVVLDGYALNPGDISWEDLNRLGEVVIYDRTQPDELLERAKGATILLTNKTPINKDHIYKLPLLKYIGVLATGYNVIDVNAAKEKGIPVCNVPGYGTTSVVQMTFALLLELCLHVQNHSNSVKDGKWSSAKDWCFWDFPLVELEGKTMGIIGLGQIGQQVAKLAIAFGMKVVGYRRNEKQNQANGYELLSPPDFFSQVDVVSIHCPLFPETNGLINHEKLKMMKKSAFLLNTSRGPIIVEEDLANALNNNVIAGAALDVLSSEPPEISNPLLKAKNCIITPHIAWATKEARVRLLDAVIKNINEFLDGSPINVVNS